MPRLLNVRYAAPFLLAGALGIFGGLKSYEYEQKREGCIPLGFSEIHQIEEDAMNEGRIDAEGVLDKGRGMEITYYLAGINDLTMKIFECWNNANKKGKDVYTQFARELEARFDPNQKKHHYELTDLFELVPQSIAHTLDDIRGITQINRTIPETEKHFDNAWDDSHYNHYHTEIYPSTEFDSKGNAHFVLKSRSVYDDTTHTYTYHPEEGHLAETSLNELISEIPDVRIKEQVHVASKLNKEGIRAAIESRKEEKKELTETELRNIANTWHAGSTLIHHSDSLYLLWKDMPDHLINWKKARLEAKSTSYTTFSSFDSGPKEYQVASNALEQCKQVSQTSARIIDSIDFTKQQIPTLEDIISKFIAANASGESPDKLGKNVLALTQQIYQKNFEKGFEVDRFRTPMVVLWSFLGAIAGVGTGVAGLLGLGKLSEKYKQF